MVVIVMPEYTVGFEAKIKDLIAELCNEENINFGLVHDSQTIKNSIENITMALVNIQEKAEGNVPEEDHKAWRKIVEEGLEEPRKKHKYTKRNLGYWAKKSRKKTGKGRFNHTPEHNENIGLGVQGYWERRRAERAPKTYGGKYRKYPVEMEKLVKDNVNTLKNQELVSLIERKFGIKTTKIRLANYMFLHGIRRDERKHLSAAHKRAIGEGQRKRWANGRKGHVGNNPGPAKKISEMTWPQARRSGLSRKIWESARSKK